ncbi:MAG: glycosyltransferase [Candidatus Aminicenantes bacterium]|nr:glycosyltransferase [Candidatus Aminicenantes bacterium]
MSKKKIWYVYYGTRGTAGAYIHSLQEKCLKNNLDSTAFVSSKYRFKTKKMRKIFFPITERTEKRNFLIKAVRYFELACGYGCLFWGAVICRPVINLSLTDDLGLTYYFFRLLKLFKLKVYITCHDVVSHHKGITKRRLKMYEDAEKLIVHSSYAFSALAEIVGAENKKKIFKFPFPSASFREILSPQRMEQAEKRLANLVGKEKDYFLFIGIVRRSKGIDTLAQAWAKCSARDTGKLVVAGKWSGAAVDLKAAVKALPNCILIDRYLEDEEYTYLIKNARFVLLPYRDYSHSAVLFSCAWSQGAVIISDIEMFKELLPGYGLTFPGGESDLLAELIDKTQGFSDEEIEKYRQILFDSVKNLDIELEKGVKKLYEEFK